MVPVALITHNPLNFLPSELATRYGIPAYPIKNTKTGQDKVRQVVLVQQTVNYQTLLGITGAHSLVFDNPFLSDDNLNKLLDDIGIFHIQF